MANRDPRIDAYIAKSAEFAKPILSYLRDAVHEACPEVEEAIKWSCPHFMYKGMLCGMAAFKQHCTFGFWKSGLIVDKDGNKAEAAWGQLGRLTAISDLPPKKVLISYIKQAKKLNDDGVKAPAKAKMKKPPPVVPEILRNALAKNAKAKATFEGLSPSHQREYVEWITEAKTEPTRERRVATAIEWLAEGKSRNWKYENC